MDTAILFWEWGPRTDAPEALGVPLPAGIPITPWILPRDANTMIDIRPDDSPAYARIYGYVADLEPSHSDNTSTGYRIEVVSKLPFLFTGHTRATNGLSHVFARIRTYARNGLFTSPTAVMLGDIVCGVTAANYGGKGYANLGVWQKSDVTEWWDMAPGTFIVPHEFDFTDWVVE